MNNWVEVVDEGQIFYVNDSLGSIQKLTNDVYVALIPRVFKLGPFKTLEEAKKVMSLTKCDIDNILEEYNLTLIGKQSKQNVEKKWIKS